MGDQQNESWFRTEAENYESFYDFQLPQAIRRAAEKLHFRRPVEPVEAPVESERCLHDDDDPACWCRSERFEFSADPQLVDDCQALDERIIEIINQYWDTFVALTEQILAQEVVCTRKLAALEPEMRDLDRRLFRLPGTNEQPY